MIMNLDNVKNDSVIDNAYIRQKELENKELEIKLFYGFLCLGLKGIFFSVIAGFFLIGGLGVLSLRSPDSNILGEHLCIMLAIVIASASLYGGYIFNRSVEISAKFGEQGFKAGSITESASNN